jgi:hypothetical protein
MEHEAAQEACALSRDAAGMAASVIAAGFFAPAWTGTAPLALRQTLQSSLSLCAVLARRDVTSRGPIQRRAI